MTWSIHNLFSALRKSWRSSLTLRVFVTTVVMSIIAATVVFVVLLTQIRDGLITQRSDDSLSRQIVELILHGISRRTVIRH